MKYYDEDDNDNTPIDITTESGEQQDEWHRPQPEPQKPANRMAFVSMICGLLGLLSVCGCVTFPVSIVSGVAAICLAAFSKKGGPFTGQAVAGLVLGILAVIFGLAAGFYLITMNLMLGDPNMAPILDQMQDMLNQSAQ